MKIVNRSILALAVTGAAVAPAAATHAKPAVKVTGEQTVVTLNGPAAKVLTSHGVAVSAVAPATLSGSSVTFPVKGGLVNKKLTRGVVRHLGAVAFTKGSRIVTVRRPVAVVTKRTAFLAVHFRHRLVRVFNLTGLKKTTTGTTTTITGQLRVTRRLAKQLNRRLGTSVRRGAVAGSATTTLTTA